MNDDDLDAPPSPRPASTGAGLVWMLLFLGVLLVIGYAIVHVAQADDDRSEALRLVEQQSNITAAMSRELGEMKACCEYCAARGAP